MEVLNFVLFQILLLCIAPCKADICGNQATLVEIDKFFITQHDNHEIELDLANYFTFFHDLEIHLNPFKNIFDNYTSDRKLNELEPFPLEPYDENRNIVLIPEKVGLLKNAPGACARRGNELISASTKSTQEHIGRIIRQFGLQFAPINVRTFQGSIYDPNFHHIMNISDAKIQAIQEGQLPVITHDGDLLVPSGVAVTTTTGTTTAPTVTTTARPQVASVLCFRKNNPWDRAENRPSWFLKTAEIAQNSLKILEKATSTFSSVKNILQNLDKHTANIGKKVKMMTPNFMTNIIKFLKKFSDQLNWEKTVPHDESLFYDFIHNVKQLNQALEQKDENLLKLKRNQLHFDAPQFVERYWNDALSYDIANQGIIPPIKLTLSKGVKDTSPSKFYANASLNIFNRNDLITVYAILPNIVEGRIISAQYVVSSPRTQFTTMTLPTKLDCIRRPFEDYPVCSHLVTAFSEQNSEQNNIDCARGLLNRDLSNHLDKCPKSSAPDYPLAYRAKCSNSNFRTAIISSTAPIKISIVCNNVENVFKDLSTFPARIDTECEVQQVSGASKRVLLAQLQRESLIKAPLEIMTPPPELKPNRMSTMVQPYVLPLLVMAGTSIFMVIVVIIIIAILEPRRLCPCCNCCRDEDLAEIPAPNVSVRSNVDGENEVQSLVFRPGSKVSTPINTPRVTSRSSSRRSLSESRIPTFRLQY